MTIKLERYGIPEGFIKPEHRRLLTQRLIGNRVEVGLCICPRTEAEFNELIEHYMPCKVVAGSKENWEKYRGKGCSHFNAWYGNDMFFGLVGVYIVKQADKVDGEQLLIRINEKLKCKSE